jgi:competence/damage-inducible protein CinA C-terminal domain
MKNVVLENIDKKIGAANVVALLVEKRLVFSTAESLTGGLLTSKFVEVPGVSDVLYEGIVSYSNGSKQSRLGVEENTIKVYGAVSAETAAEMASCLLKNADIGISTTGIAGPSGGTDRKPVGLTYIALADGREIYVSKQIFSGNRQEIREKAANYAISMLFLYLKGNIETAII